MYPRNAASPPRISIGPVVQISDGAVQASGCTVRIIVEGGAEGDGGGTTAYSTDGVVLYTPTQAETNYVSFVLIAKKTGCIPATVTVVTTASATAGTVKPADGSIVAATFAADAIPAAAVKADAVAKIVRGLTAPDGENMIQWILDDNAASTTVTGSEVNAALVGGNTADVAATCNGKPAFHLNGSSQYVALTLPNVWPSAVRNLWTKAATNPVLSVGGQSVQFGQLAPKPGGGWYWFGAYGNGGSICRWESVDLKTWTNKITVLAGGGAGDWDYLLQVASAFQKPDGTWILLYRGWKSGTGYAIGLATSADGTTFTRKNNGGVDDGKFPQFGTNYDLVGVILVDGTYYVYVNGSPTHGTTNVYHSTDFVTFTASSSNPLWFGFDAFCAHVWYEDGQFYMLVCRDFGAGSTLYYHVIALYRSTSPLFTLATTEFLGHAAVNDRAYDADYLDTPSVTTTSVSRNEYASEFGNTLYMLYDGVVAGGQAHTQCLASMPLDKLPKLKPRLNQLYNQKVSISLWVQFDALVSNKPVWSASSAYDSAAPRWLMQTVTVSGSTYLRLYLADGYHNCNTPLAINTPYHVVVVEDQQTRRVYLNGVLDGEFTAACASSCTGLFIGSGYGGYLDGYVWDFRIYPYDLSGKEVANLYTTNRTDSISDNFALSVRDSLKLSPSTGNPASNSIDRYADDLLAVAPDNKPAVDAAGNAHAVDENGEALAVAADQNQPFAI